MSLEWDLSGRRPASDKRWQSSARYTVAKYVTKPPGWLSLPSLRGRPLRTSFSWEGQGRYGSFPLADERGVQVKLWDTLRMCAIPERLRSVFMTRRYTNTCLPFPLPYLYGDMSLRNYSFTCTGNWRKDCQNCLVLYCVWEFIVIITKITWAVLTSEPRASWCSFKRRLIGLCCAYTAFLCEVSILGIIFVCVYVYVVGCYENGCQYQCSWLPEKTPHLWNSAIIASCHLFRDSLAIFSLYDRRDKLWTEFFHKIFHPSGCLHYLLPNKRHNNQINKLGNHSFHSPLFACTQKFKNSFLVHSRSLPTEFIIVFLFV